MRRGLYFWFSIIAVLVVILIILINVFVFVYLSEIQKHGFSKVYDNIPIDFTDLNKEEISKINETLQELKPEYYNLAKSYIFSKNQSIIGYSAYNKNVSLLGRNVYDNIYVLYTDNQEFDSFTLCHELLHSIISDSLGYNISEWFTDDIEEYAVCYK